MNRYIIDRLYNTLKRKARKSIEANNWDSALEYIQLAGKEAYHFNLAYTDEDLENLLEMISTKITKCNHYIGDNNRIVFFNSFFSVNKGLTQQYLRALNAIGKQILYISDTEKIKGSLLYDELLNFDNLNIEIIPDTKKGIIRSQYIYDKIINFNPSKVFTQLSPQCSEAITAFNALPVEIAKYQINLTDHTFWLGQRFLDYNLEFRQYGCSVSFKKRNIPKEKIILMPFYSIESNLPFQGFPVESDNKVIILSGGNFYKIYDKESTYINLVKSILDLSDDVIFYFAGEGDKDLFNELTNNPKYNKRFRLLGFRNDIDQIIEHCDIYLNTYPFSGGLMCQYAARHGKPILSYFTAGTSKAEEFVCQINETKISLDDKAVLIEHAKRLIGDINYRKQLGKANQNCIMTDILFQDRLKRCLDNEVLENPKPLFNLDVRVLDVEQKIQQENMNFRFAKDYHRALGIKALMIDPIFSISFILGLSKLLMKKLTNKD